MWAIILSELKMRGGMVPLTAVRLPEVGCTMLKGNGIFDCKVSIQNDFLLTTTKKKRLNIILYLQSGPSEKL